MSKKSGEIKSKTKVETDEAEDNFKEYIKLVKEIWQDMMSKNDIE